MSSEYNRPLGLSERYSLTRSLLSSQPLPIVLFNLVPPAPLLPFALLQHIQASLASLLPLHPTLFARFTDIHSSSPGLTFLPRIDVQSVVSFGQVSSEGAGLDSVLETVVGRELELEKENGKEGEVTPPWRVLVFVSDDSTKGFWLGIAGHHSLFDGQAVLKLTQALVEALKTSSASPPSTARPFLVVPLPDSPTFPPTLDSVRSSSVSLRTLIPIIFTEILLPKLPWFLRPAPAVPSTTTTWTGALSSSSDFRRKHHLTLHLPSTLTNPLIVLCRKNQTSLTSLLNTLLARSIRTYLLPSDSSSVVLKSNTALSLRPPHLQTLAGGSYVGGFPFVNSPITSPSASNDDESQIWLTSRTHYSSLREPSVIPSALEQWALLSYLPSASDDAWVSYFLPKTDTKEWDTSFEISNLGRVPSESVALPEGWTLGGMIFTQSPQAMGPAMTFSVVGWEGGLTVGCGWEEGVLKEGARDAIRVWEGVRREVERLVGGAAQS